MLKKREDQLKARGKDAKPTEADYAPLIPSTKLLMNHLQPEPTLQLNPDGEPSRFKYLTAKETLEIEQLAIRYLHEDLAKAKKY